MRVSVRKNDTGFMANAYIYNVKLNGEKLKHCFTADEEKGEAFVYAEDAEGKLMIDRVNECFVEKRLTGKVVIYK